MQAVPIDPVEFARYAERLVSEADDYAYRFHAAAVAELLEPEKAIAQIRERLRAIGTAGQKPEGRDSEPGG